jgi:hypothetical protein
VFIFWLPISNILPNPQPSGTVVLRTIKISFYEDGSIGWTKGHPFTAMICVSGLATPHFDVDKW